MYKERACKSTIHEQSCYKRTFSAEHTWINNCTAIMLALKFFLFLRPLPVHDCSDTPSVVTDAEMTGGVLVHDQYQPPCPIAIP